MRGRQSSPWSCNLKEGHRFFSVTLDLHAARSSIRVAQIISVLKENSKISSRIADGGTGLARVEGVGRFWVGGRGGKVRRIIESFVRTAGALGAYRPLAYMRRVLTAPS